MFYFKRNHINLTKEITTGLFCLVASGAILDIGLLVLGEQSPGQSCPSCLLKWVWKHCSKRRNCTNLSMYVLQNSFAANVEVGKG